MGRRLTLWARPTVALGFLILPRHPHHHAHQPRRRAHQRRGRHRCDDPVVMPTNHAVPYVHRKRGVVANFSARQHPLFVQRRSCELRDKRWPGVGLFLVTSISISGNHRSSWASLLLRRSCVGANPGNRSRALGFPVGAEDQPPPPGPRCRGGRHRHAGHGCAVVGELQRFSKNLIRARCKGRFGTSVLSPLGVVSCDLTA